MSSISTYVSGHTELADVNEFFQKQLLHAGERPIAFFDGVFYESHQERVGNIAFQDYLVYADKAVYLWARGANKDFLDRFVLGTVSITSRNKDSDFSTLDLKIIRDGKEPISVIFDMVERDESEKIIKLHTTLQSILQNCVGDNFMGEIPDEIADQLVVAAMHTCPPSPLSFSPSAHQFPEQNSRIGYGQDLLEQYKASIGYPNGERPEPAPPFSSTPSGSLPKIPGLPKELEGVLPTDPESLKKIAGSLRNAIGETPFKFRDQVMKDLQRVPGDVTAILTAASELLSNVAGNPKAEKFVMNAIHTAVKNDGILGSVGNMIRMAKSMGGTDKNRTEAQSAARTSGARRAGDADNEGAGTRQTGAQGLPHRKKVVIQADEKSRSGGADSGENEPHCMEPDSLFGNSGHRAKPAERKARSKKIRVAPDEPQSASSPESLDNATKQAPDVAREEEKDAVTGKNRQGAHKTVVSESAPEHGGNTEGAQKKVATGSKSS